jgi:acyl dehydratase
MKDLGFPGRGFFFEDLALGTSWHSAGRTLLEADLAAYVNLSWFTEELFTNLDDRSDNVIGGRPVPALMVMAFAEGLIVPTLERTGLAFLHSEMNVLSPTFLGETIQVQCEVIEARLTSKGDRGLVRTRNAVVTQAGRQTLEYKPLRMIKLREPQDCAKNPIRE